MTNSTDTRTKAVAVHHCQSPRLSLPGGITFATLLLLGREDPGRRTMESSARGSRCLLALHLYPYRAVRKHQGKLNES